MLKQIAGLNNLEMTGLLRALTELQLVSAYGIAWFTDMFVGVSPEVMLFVALYGEFYLTFRAAKRRRETLENVLGDE